MKVVLLKGRLAGSENDSDAERLEALRQLNYSQGKRCVVCDKPVSNDSGGCCRSCGIVLRDERRRVRETMNLILPVDSDEEALERVRACLARRGIVRKEEIVNEYTS